MSALLDIKLSDSSFYCGYNVRYFKLEDIRGILTKHLAQSDFANIASDTVQGVLHSLNKSTKFVHSCAMSYRVIQCHTESNRVIPSYTEPYRDIQINAE